MFTEPKWIDRSFFDEIDAMCPAYVSPPMERTSNGEGAVLTGDQDPIQRTTVARAYDRTTGEPRDVEFSMPWQKYIRMLDPKGHVQAVDVATCQNAFEDASGHGPAKVQRKITAGWLSCERNAPNMMGLQGDAYGEYLRGEYLKRQAAEDRAYEQREAALISQAERAAALAQEKQTEAIVSAVERGQHAGQSPDLAAVLARLNALEQDNQALRAQVEQRRKDAKAT